MKEKKLLDVGKQKYSTYKQSANTLFKFVDKIEYLIEYIGNMKMYPRYVEENVTYLNLKLGKKNINNVSFPMICFCDIHIHKLKDHVENDPKTDSGGYGKYGIGLDKEWCEEQGFQPITYLNTKSRACKELGSMMNKGLQNIYEEKDIDEEFFDYVLNNLMLSKPLSGSMYMGKAEDKNDGMISKNFHDEREWRFLPDVPNTEESFFNDATNSELMTPEIRNRFSEGLKGEPSTHVDLEIDAIKYIFVDTEKDRNELINVIKERFSEDLTSAMILASKILIYEQIKGDW
ncbi:abortive infection system antitoxin AbiGi family protein [Enterococcus faecalis]|uniref:abortive infection system antitoxin AbiGi family protein n=1 Tax=Enterococcus faecalis TaxID=1351 RepID=UPI001F532203|nr:abortive infection system antitoxin AbiGi family protein [Enterococcus faecalis]MCI1171888.1 abortive infection system antitoxin AbiGi family protein [Enterococcus faecalis]MCT6644686.1 abortive infection system antitoxin AbiGi family protein [Enterococcus faecalis]